MEKRGISVEGWSIAAAFLCLAVFGGVTAAAERRRRKELVERMERMLDAAEKGAALSECFDEGRMSALETRFMDFCRSSAVSAEQIKVEKDRIKELIGDISHQTKTPVANLLLYSELLKEQELPEETHEMTKALHGQTEKLHFLIDSLVKLSRLENGILALYPQKEPLSPMLKKLQEQFAAKAAEKGLVFEVEVTDASARIDAKWTLEALGNLVDNAIKYTESGSVRVSVTEYQMFVRIDVEDTGIGIAEEDMAGIFQRFYRAEQVRESEGVGLGLYLARRIAAEEGGYMKVESEPGAGSRFSMFLPA